MSSPGDSQRLVFALVLSFGPGLLGALCGQATFLGLGLTLVTQCALWVVICGHRAGRAPAAAFADGVAWLAAAGSSLATTLLSSPEPFWLGSNTTGRRLVIAAGGLVTAVAVGILLKGVIPRESAEARDASPEATPQS